MMGRGIAVVAALAAVAAAAAPAGVVLSTVWGDPAGDVDGQTAPDIRSVEVRETLDRLFVSVRFDAGGARYAVSERERFVDSVSVRVDVVSPRRPGYLASHQAGMPNQGVLETLRSGPDGPRMRLLAANGGPSAVTFAVPKLALGNPRSVELRVQSGRTYFDAPELGGADTSPAAGSHAYRLTPLRLALVELPRRALRPRAGAIFSLRGTKGVLVNSRRVSLERLAATARLDGRPLARHGLVWRLPRDARGRRLEVTVSGRVGASQISVTRTLRVR